MIKVPWFVEQFVDNEIKKVGQIVVDIDEYLPDDSKIIKKYGLIFGSDKYFHGLADYKISLNDYVVKILTYSTKNVRIYLNKTLLSDIESLGLPAPNDVKVD